MPRTKKTSPRSSKKPSEKHVPWFLISVSGLCLMVVYIFTFSNILSVEYSRADAQGPATTSAKNGLFGLGAAAPAPTPTLDKAAYDKKMIAIANYPISSTTASTTKHLWPASAPYPNVGALLPNHRIVAYYGNFYSKGMGVLGQYPAPVMIQKLQAAVAQWTAADPSTPAIPAIDYIVVTAQGSAGSDGKYRFRMPDSQIDHAVDLANQVHGIVILDVQVGLSTVQTEVPLLEKYLKMPQVHLALDPEFDMHNGAKPGSVIGSMDASEINFAANYLATLVRDNNLPPKVLIIHRFTQNMVMHTSLIRPLPEVQIVMDMDGWGFAAKKINTYNQVINPYPVQFTGFKLFYKNDLLPPSTRMLLPSEILKLKPQPLFIQYQ